jgi:hypothetical protein
MTEIADSLWQRAFWKVVENAKNNNREEIAFREVDDLVLHWSKMPTERLIEQLVKRRAGKMSFGSDIATAHNFREGEVVCVAEDENYLFYYCWDKHVNSVVTEWSRPLRLSEMPQAVIDMVQCLEACRDGGEVITGDVAARILAKFDVKIEK